MSEDSIAAMQEMAAPGSEHDLLKPFVGTFRAEVKIWMGPGDPMVSTGTMTNSLELGGRFLQQVYKGGPGPSPFPNFEGRGYWGHNKATQKYEGFWIDTASTIMQTESGTVDDSGKVWTMVGEMVHQPGQTVRAGGTLRTRIGVLAIDSVACVSEPEITDADARKLKELGLTESLETGYRLSPRGVEYWRRIRE